MRSFHFVFFNYFHTFGSVLTFQITEWNFLLVGLKKWFEIAGSASKWVAGLAVAFPGTLYYFRKEIGLVNDALVKYVICPKCHALYEFDKCCHNVGTNRVSNKCSFVKFPNHRQRW